MTTTVYLIRHGIAAERGTYANDEERPLTEKGQRKTKTIAQRLEGLKLHFDVILTSPLVRAKQTAQILQDVGLGDKLQVMDELAPGGRCDRWLQWLQTWQQHSEDSCIALVGHEPDLSDWAEQLIGTRRPGHLVLKKGGIIGLQVPAATTAMGNSELFWLTPPKVLLSEARGKR